MNKKKIQNKLPVGWAWMSLSDIVSPISRINGEFEVQNATFNYIDIESINNKTFKITTTKTYTWYNAPSRAQQKVEANDILFSNVRPYLKNIALVPPKLHGDIASTGFCIIRPFIINPRYVFYYVLTQSFVNVVSGFAKGTSYPAVTNSIVLSQKIPIAPLEEQKIIVEKIEEIFSDLDKSEQTLKIVIKQIEIQRFVLLKNAFEGKLSEIWRKSNRPVPETSLNGNFEILNDDEINELPKIPHEWHWSKLGKMGNLLSGQHILEIDYNNNNDGIAYLTGPSDFGEEFPVVSKWTIHPKVLAKKDDILITVKGSGVGKINIMNVEAAIGRQLMAFSATSKEKKFFFFYLESKFLVLQKLSTGSAIPGLDRDTILNLPCPVVSLEEQRYIVEELEYQFSIMKSFEKDVEKTIGDINIFRESVLQKAFQGQLVPRTQNFEDVSKMLSKIIIEKEKYLEKEKTKFKLKPKNKKNMQEKLSIIAILKDSTNEVPTQEVWKRSAFSLDIDEFYSQVKDLIESNQISETTRKGKQSYLTIKGQ